MSSEIDFSTQKPEQVRKVLPLSVPVNWEALNLVVDRSTGTLLQKSQMRRKFLKAVRNHGIEALTPQFRYSYCCARLALGDFSSYFGWEFRDYAEGSSGEWAARLYWDETWLPKWGGGSVNRLLVLGEQGVGDQIFFASILPEAMVRCREVIVECDRRLHDLLERSFPGLQCRDEMPFEDRRSRYGPIDAFIPMADLMRMFRRARSHFPGKPYLKPDPRRVAGLEYLRGRTGVAWRGRQGSIRPDSLEIENPVCLQYKERARPGYEEPPVDLWGDFEGMTALCSVLDRVVTVPMTIHHVAGAVGCKTQIIVPDLGGEVVNQIRWDHPVGRLPWYADAEVFANMKEWKNAQGKQGGPRLSGPEARRDGQGESRPHRAIEDGPSVSDR